MRHPGWTRWSALGLVAILIAACSSGSPSASTPAAATPAAPSATTSAASAPVTSDAPPSADATAAPDAVCEAGKAEGKLVYWNNFAKPDLIFAAFNAKYPGIVVDPLTSRPDDFTQALPDGDRAGASPPPTSCTASSTSSSRSSTFTVRTPRSTGSSSG